MKSCIVLLVLSVAVMASARPEGDQYTDRYDSVDLEEIIANPRLLEAYFKCVMDEGKCTPDGKELKENIPDALENGCAKCSETHKKGTKRVLSHLINHEKDYWNKLTAKYDPEGKFAAKYEKEYKEIKE